MTSGTTICFACQRYRKFDKQHPNAYCAAFPQGIPDDILFGGFDHRKPHVGDNGILFEISSVGKPLLKTYEASPIFKSQYEVKRATRPAHAQLMQAEKYWADKIHEVLKQSFNPKAVAHSKKAPKSINTKGLKEVLGQMHRDGYFVGFKGANEQRLKRILLRFNSNHGEGGRFAEGSGKDNREAIANGGKSVPARELEYGYMFPDGSAAQITSSAPTHQSLAGGGEKTEAILAAGGVRVIEPGGGETVYHIDTLNDTNAGLIEKNLDFKITVNTGYEHQYHVYFNSGREKSFTATDYKSNNYDLRETLDSVGWSRPESWISRAAGDDDMAKLAEAAYNFSWDNWSPGNADAAALLGDGGPGLQELLNEAGVTIKNIDATTMADVEEFLQHAIEEGQSVDVIADGLGELIGYARAAMVATTELARAQSAATQDVYQYNGIKQFNWLPSDDACPECEAMVDGNPYDVDSEMPPLHPRCRCAVTPVTEAGADEEEVTSDEEEE